VKSICVIAVGLHTATHLFCFETGIDNVIRCYMQFEIGRSGGDAIRNSKLAGLVDFL
jgi:hypothetical protein